MAKLLPIEVYKDFIAEAALVAQTEMNGKGEALAWCWSSKTYLGSSACMRGKEDDCGLVYGVALKFATADFASVTSRLDYRERKGYLQTIVKFFPLEDGGQQQQGPRKVHAFAYVGLPCNTYFYCFPDCPISSPFSKRGSKKFLASCEQETKDESSGSVIANAGVRCACSIDKVEALRTQGSAALLGECCPDDLAHAARMIVRGKGVSGSNVEYLFKLADFLREIQQVDAHVFNLEEKVKRMVKQTALQNA